MAPRTSTTHLSTLSFPTSGTLSFPLPASPLSHTSVELPPGSKFDSELHWHESYTEYFRVSKGVLRLLLENEYGVLEASYVGPRSGVVEIPRGRRHRLRRGDLGDGPKTWVEGVEFREGGVIDKGVWEGEVKGEEWTAPADGRKQLFFRNLAGVVGERKGKGGDAGWVGGAWKSWEEVLVAISVFAVMREFDNWPAFLGGRFRRVEWVVSHVLLAVVSWIGVFFGVRGWYEEYTPRELRGVMVGGEGKKDL